MTHSSRLRTEPTAVPHDSDESFPTKMMGRWTSLSLPVYLLLLCTFLFSAGREQGPLPLRLALLQTDAVGRETRVRWAFLSPQFLVRVTELRATAWQEYCRANDIAQTILVDTEATSHVWSCKLTWTLNNIKNFSSSFTPVPFQEFQPPLSSMLHAVLFCFVFPILIPASNTEVDTDGWRLFFLSSVVYRISPSSQEVLLDRDGWNMVHVQEVVAVFSNSNWSPGRLALGITKTSFIR